MYSSAQKLYFCVISGLSCNYLNKTLLSAHFLSYSSRSFYRSLLHIQRSSRVGFFIIAFLYSDYLFKDSRLSPLLRSVTHPSDQLLKFIISLFQISSGLYHFGTAIQLCPSSLSLLFRNGLLSLALRQ